MATLRTVIQGIAAADSTLVAMLGSGVNGIYPNPAAPTPGKPPWIQLSLLGEVSQDEIISTLGFRWRVYDDPRQGYSRIDHIMGRLKHLFKTEVNVSYADPGGQAFKQRYTYTSPDAFDDGYSQNVRWMEWQLWRVKP